MQQICGLIVGFANELPSRGRGYWKFPVKRVWT